MPPVSQISVESTLSKVESKIASMPFRPLVPFSCSSARIICEECDPLDSTLLTAGTLEGRLLPEYPQTCPISICSLALVALSYTHYQVLPPELPMHQSPPISCHSNIPIPSATREFHLPNISRASNLCIKETAMFLSQSQNCPGNLLPFVSSGNCPNRLSVQFPILFNIHIETICSPFSALSCPCGCVKSGENQFLGIKANF